MGMKQVTGASILALFVLTLSSVAIGGDQQGELPPVVKKYPDKQLYDQQSSNKLTIYTKDDFSKVNNFYRKTLRMDPISEGKFLVGQNVRKLSGPSHTDSALWLEISNKKYDLLDEKDLFGFLQGEITVKKIHSAQELKQVKRKYSHLAGAWYPDYDAQKKLKSCSEATRASVNASEKKVPKRNKEREQAMMAQMQALMAQGRHQEAARLAQESIKPGVDLSSAIQQENKTDHWDEWVACLDEVDRHDFRTKVEIDLVTEHFKPGTEAQRKEWLDQR